MEKIKTQLTVWFSEWKRELLVHKYLILLSIVFCILAIIGNTASSRYVDKIPTTSVNDLILDHLPTLDLYFVFIYGALLLFLVLGFYVVIFKIREFHIVVSQFSLLLLMRSFFVVLTHMGQPEGVLAVTNAPWFYQFLNFNNDLFFSGHTAFPFLAFLLFKNEKIGKFFLILTFIMAFTVLGMHMHYSIDVFSAIFITYGSYKIGQWIFRKINHN